MSAPRLDDLDRRIVDRLSRDARVSNRQIAVELNVTEGTIRSRVKRMQADRLVQFTVVTDFRFAGSPNLVMLGIQAEPVRAAALARELTGFAELNCVMLLLGRYSIFAMGLFQAIEHVHHLVTEKIRPLRGVLDVEVSISIHNFKYEAGIARIVD